MDSDGEGRGTPAWNRRDALARHMARVAEGDKDALAEVYRLTSAKLNGLLVAMLRDRSQAEEVLQDVYLTVWRRASSFDPDRASPITWLVTIARNRAIDRLRSGRAFAGTLPIEEAELVDPSPSVVDRLESAEHGRNLLRCVETLEERQQALIRAAFFEGLTYELLAKRENVPLGTMKSWIRRSLLRLRACMGTHLP